MERKKFLLIFLSMLTCKSPSLVADFLMHSSCKFVKCRSCSACLNGSCLEGNLKAQQ